MKNLNEILAEEDITKRIKLLKNKPFELPVWDELEKLYEPSKHAIFDTSLFPDKPIKDDDGNIIAIELFTRVALGLQKLAVKRMSEFMFTLPPDLSCEDASTDVIKEAQFNSLKRVLKRNKWDSLNKRRCKIVSSQCEQATYWYLTDSPNSLYGFKSSKKLKHVIFCPENGDELFPLFDAMGDMIAFSRGFSIRDEGDKKVKMFETWTAEMYYRWQQRNGASEWEEVLATPNVITKIPVTYTKRNTPIWEGADDGKVLELEKLLSRNGEIIAYHAAPVLIIKGELQGAPRKNEENKVFTTESGGGAEYVSWQQSPESVRFQFDTILRMYFTELQLPDLSFENIKGLGAASGEARKWLLADAHLKVGDESEIYSEMVDREFSILKEYLGLMNTSWADSIRELEIETTFNPFIISDEKTKIDILVAANGNKPLVSHERSVELAGLSEKPAEDWIKIQAELDKENARDILEPAL